MAYGARLRRTLTAITVLAAVVMGVWAAVHMQTLRRQAAPPDGAIRATAADIDELLSAARRSVAQGDLSAAGDHYQRVADLDPTAAEATAYGGWVAFLEGDAQQALDDLEASLQDAPFYADAHLLRGLVLLRGFDDEVGAATEFQTVLRLDPDGLLGRSARDLLDEILNARQEVTDT